LRNLVYLGNERISRIMLRKYIIYLMACSVFMVGCGGRVAHPIMSHQPNDLNLNCDLLIHEIGYLNLQYKKKTKEYDLKEAADVGLLVGGWWLLGIPWFFIDLKDAEKVEYEAIQARILHLVELAKIKKCENVPTISY